MTWVRLDDLFPDHPKVQRVSDPAAWLFVCGLCYCARLTTYGRIPALAVSTLTHAKKPLQLAAELLAVELWEQGDDDYIVHDYLVYNPTAEQLKEKRDKAAVRKRSQRMSQRDRPVTEGGTGVGLIAPTRTPPRDPGRQRGGLGAVVEVGEAFQGTTGLDAINQAVEILSSVWQDVDPVGVENCAAMDPDADLVAAARLAAVWGTGPDWTMAAAASLASAMRNLKSKASGRPKAERDATDLAAIGRLIERTA